MIHWQHPWKIILFQNKHFMTSWKQTREIYMIWTLYWPRWTSVTTLWWNWFLVVCETMWEYTKSLIRFFINLTHYENVKKKINDKNKLYWSCISFQFHKTSAFNISSPWSVEILLQISFAFIAVNICLHILSLQESGHLCAVYQCGGKWKQK